MRTARKPQSEHRRATVLTAGQSYGAIPRCELDGSSGRVRCRRRGLRLRTSFRNTRAGNTASDFPFLKQRAVPLELVGHYAGELIEAQASPLALLPFGVPQEYVVSSLRYPVVPARPLAAGRTTLAVQDYPALAKAAGDDVVVQIVPSTRRGSARTYGRWP